eukprot:1158728-Pelagomonas_calceolata.AAC.4
MSPSPTLSSSPSSMHCPHHTSCPSHHPACNVPITHLVLLTILQWNVPITYLVLLSILQRNACRAPLEDGAVKTTYAHDPRVVAVEAHVHDMAGMPSACTHTDCSVNSLKLVCHSRDG